MLLPICFYYQFPIICLENIPLRSDSYRSSIPTIQLPIATPIIKDSPILNDLSSTETPLAAETPMATEIPSVETPPSAETPPAAHRDDTPSAPLLSVAFDPDYHYPARKLDAKAMKAIPILAKLQEKFTMLKEDERDRLIEKAKSYQKKFRNGHREN